MGQDSIFAKIEITQVLAFYAIYPLIWLIARLPFTVLYWISDGLFYVLYYIVKYRREVVLSNLKIAFPEKTKEQLNELSKKSMHHFCDLFLELVKSTGISKKELQKRFLCENVEVVNAFAKAGQPMVLMIGHQASYEWTIALGDQLSFKNYAVYKPIKNREFDAFIRQVRAKFGTILIPMKKAYNSIRESQKTNETGLYALVADQAPKPNKAQYFTQFFDKTTSVFMGGERMASQYGMPVYFLRITKVKRGYYTSRFEKISDDASKEKEWFVTDSFFTMLEDQIKKQPSLYLWTHKRWKTSPSDIKRVVGLSPRVPQ